MSFVKTITSLIKKHKFKLIIALLLIFLIVWRVLAKQQTNKTELVFANPEYRDLVKTLELTGIVDAKKKARLRFLAGGKIVYLGAEEGDQVKQWQTIASIDQRDLQKRLERSLNSYMQERWDWEDLQDEIKDELLDTSEQRSVDKEQWSLNNSVIDVELQDIAISQSVMSSPFTGILVSSPVTSTHTQVTATDYFEVIDPNSLIFKAEINEEDVPLVRVGQSATIELDAYPNQPLTTNLSYISYQSSVTSSGTVFIIELPMIVESDQENNESVSGKSILDKYRLGMNGDVSLELEKKDNVLTVPLIAIKQRDGQSFVEVKTSNNNTEDRFVEVGLETEEYVEIISGLSEEDFVVIPSFD